MGQTEQEREELKKAYPHSVKWRQRVDAMSPNQVTAIYIRLKSEGKLGK